MKTAIVVGGGFAGLAAATALTDRGLEVQLVERRPFLGGKAFSFADRAAGHSVDNGQHAFLSAYRNTLALLDRWGTRHLVAFGRRLDLVFMTSAGKAQRFRSAGLPAPFHLLGALLQLGSLSWRDRLAAAIPATRLLALDAAGRAALDGVSFGAWLRRCGQRDRAIQAFWEPLALAAINGRPDEISAYMALQVLALGFLGSEATSHLGYATLGLSALFEPAADYLRARGGTVILGREVSEVGPAGTGSAGNPASGRRWNVRFRDGGAIEADHVVLAVPPWRLERLLAPDLRGQAGLGVACELPASPIVSVQLTLDRPVVPFDAVALLGSPVHWVFAVGRLRTDAPAGALALTTSSGHDLAALGHAEVRKLALAELARFFPASRTAQVLSCRVVKEMDATLACVPGLDASRPEPATRLGGLFVAGSWTRTGLPGTIEGATMSGLAAAEAIERERGRPCSLVQPLSEPGGLAALLRRL